jgi:hypothetical protein
MIRNQFDLNKTYIIGRLVDLKDASEFPSNLKKVRVIEITKCSILLEDLDSPGGLKKTHRSLLEEMNKNWKIIEILEDLPAQTFSGQGPTTYIALNS